MRSEMRAYFAGERKQGALLVALAAASLAWTVRAGGAWVAAALPVATAALAVGAIMVARAPRQARALGLLLVTDPGAFRRDELARMARRASRLRAARLAALAVLAASLALLLSFRDNATWRAVGLAFAAQMLALLALDLSAQMRARRYVASLTRFLDPAAPIEGERETFEG